MANQVEPNRVYDKYVAMGRALDEAETSGVLQLERLNLFTVRLVLSLLSHFAHCEAGAQVPDRVFEMPHLVHLSLAGNKIEELPFAIGMFKHLASLDVSDNKLHALPWNLGNLTRLQSIELTGNPFEVLAPCARQRDSAILCPQGDFATLLAARSGGEALQMLKRNFFDASAVFPAPETVIEQPEPAFVLQAPSAPRCACFSCLDHSAAVVQDG